jgi:hypothetical protein
MEAIKGTCVGPRDGIDSLDLPVALMAGTLNPKIHCIMHYRFLLNKNIEKGPCLENFFQILAR